MVQESEAMDDELLRALAEASDEAGVNLASALYPTALHWSGISDGLLAVKLKTWLASIRRRYIKSSSPDLLNGHNGTRNEFQLNASPTSVVENSGLVRKEFHELNLKERLRNCTMIDINSPEFNWENLVSLYHSEHATSNKSMEDDARLMEVTVNSGGVVYFAIFRDKMIRDSEYREAAAVLKFTSSSLVTESERFGNELAKHMGVLCPQSRVIHKGSKEWEEIQRAVETCMDMEISCKDNRKETCMELLEALSLSQCTLLMGYVKGSPLLSCQHAFSTQIVAKKTAAALGRVFLLDLVLRNEDRLSCPALGWRGNPDNLLFLEESLPGDKHFERLSSSEFANVANDKQESIKLGDIKFSSVDSLDNIHWQPSVPGDLIQDAKTPGHESVYLVTIDSGVPRRPPAGKRANDKVCYPKVVELILNNTDYAASILHDISCSNLGAEATASLTVDQMEVVKAFQKGLKEGIRDMRNLYVFLLKLLKMLQIVLQKFFQSITQMFPPENEDKDDSPGTGSKHSLPHYNGSPVSHTRAVSSQRCSHEGVKKRDASDENVQGSRSFAEHQSHKDGPHESAQLSKQLTIKLKNVGRTAKLDPKLNEELKHWNELLDSEGRQFCQDHGFVTGFLEGGTSHSIFRNYEFKVRLEHVLERMTLISQAADTQRPSKVTENLYIGGALAANSFHTLKHIGITHVLSLCPTELPECRDEFKLSFHYKEIHVLDQETSDISCFFNESSDFIGISKKMGGKCLVHCFEGRSRSATIVLAYLMLHENLKLSQAWEKLKSVHRRAQPNDRFMDALLELEKQIHGEASMQWQRKKPMMQVCSICGKATGLNVSSLEKHMERLHLSVKQGEGERVNNNHQIM